MNRNFDLKKKQMQAYHDYKLTVTQNSIYNSYLRLKRTSQEIVFTEIKHVWLFAFN